MEIKDILKLKIQTAVNSLGVSLDLSNIIIENSRDLSHGDYASNVALKNARLFGKAPVQVANLIKDVIDMEGIEKIEIE